VAATATVGSDASVIDVIPTTTLPSSSVDTMTLAIAAPSRGVRGRPVGAARWAAVARVSVRAVVVVVMVGSCGEGVSDRGDVTFGERRMKVLKRR
jgi:hypothetical protein